MEGQKKPKKNSKASASGGKKSPAKKRVVRRTTKKVSIKRSATKRRPSVRLAPSVATIPLPVTVQTTHRSMKRTEPHDNLSLRRHIISIFSLVAMSVVSLAVIAGFAQVTFMDIESLNSPAISLMKPMMIESRFIPSVAGELTLGMPATWAVTNEGDNTITYTHATVTGTTLTITVQTNETDNIFTYLQAHQPDYTNAVVVASDPAVLAWRGVTVTATTTDEVPLQIVYIPIQKNLGERYIVTIRAEIPTEESKVFVQQAFDSLLENLDI